MKHKKFLTALLIGGIITSGVMAVPLSACGGDKTAYVTLNVTSDKMRLGQTYTDLVVTVKDGGDITWTSSDESVATVDSRGNVKGVTEGTVIITATSSEGHSASCTLQVIDGTWLEVVEETKETEAKVTGKTYYVSPTGTSTATGTENDPYDIYTLLNCDPNADDWNEVDPILQAGDTVIVKNGEYNLSTRIRMGYSGNYANPITIKKEDADGKAVLKFYDMTFDSNNRGVQINGDYFVWDSIDIAGAGDNGMYVGGSYNMVVNCEFYDNRDTGLQLGRAYSSQSSIDEWPSYNLIKNCTSYNNYDNETYGENADGFAAKLTVGYGNIFDGCIAYRNSDDGWDLYAKTDTGNIGAVIIYNCVAFENGFIMESQESFNAKFKNFTASKAESNTKRYDTRDGDGNGFKLGGSIMEGEVMMYNCLSFHNRMHGVTDNSNPGVLTIDKVTSYNNAASVDNEPTSSTYGQVVYAATSADECANIDVARQTYSYNHISNILSVNNGNSYLVADNYRGTVENCLLQAKSYSYQVTTVEEYDTKESICGEKVSAPSATSLFKAIPGKDFGISYSSGYTSAYHYIDDTCRNSDGSVNMGDYFALKDTSSGRGSVLTETSYDGYTHWAYSDLTGKESRQAATAQAIYDMLYLPIDETSCYQDFKAVSTMMGYPIFWTSSDPDVLSVSSKIYDSTSGNKYNLITVNRPTDADKEVTLTAEINVGDVAVLKRTFTINVKKNTFKIGDISVPDVEEDQVITELGDSSFSLQDPVVVNGASESGQIIDSSLYDVTTSYAYKSSTDSDYVDQRRFNNTNPQSAGIWKITLTVTLKSTVTLNHTATNTASYSYLVYVASADNDVDFTSGSAGLYVNKGGFTIYGEPSNPTGIVYVLTKEKGATAPTANEVVASGTKTEFRATSFTQDYEHSNDSAYNVYYVVSNSTGSAYSSVHSISVATKDISTKSDFENMLASNNASTIYRLVNDIDCQGSLTVSLTPFIGLFNGMGHTIKNVSITNTSGTEDSKGFGIFRVVENGTITNVKFDNITVTESGAHEKTGGIVGAMYGGSISNIRISNITIKANIRVGALIGQIISEGEGECRITAIDNIEVINEASYEVAAINSDTFSSEKYYTYAGGVYTIAESYVDGTTYYQRKADISGDRASAVVGFVQGGNSGAAYNIVTISNCYADLCISTGDYGGGIVGRSDDRNAKDELHITNCYFSGVIYATKRAAGILGGFTGAGITRITGCISTATVYYGNNLEVVVAAQKNSSGIVGNFASNADMLVTKCYAKFAEYNSDYGVEVANSWTLSHNKFNAYWETNMGFDMTDTWEYIYEEGSTTALEAPFIRLK